MNRHSNIKDISNNELVELSTEIVCAYVSNNVLSPSDVVKFISEVHAALKTVHQEAMPQPEVKLKPAVSIKKSIYPDYLICLEDGKKFKSLKRHIRTQYGLSPAEYREKWGLPATYPMVAPNYSKVRSRLAKANGLGRKSG